MSNEPVTDAPRRIAGRYELRSVIGRGGAGTVWKAEDVLLRRLVAVKEVHLPPTLDESERRVLRERVLREARSAAAVRHPVLVTVFDVVEDGGRPWIVLELVEARTLAARVDEELLTPEQAARIGIDLLAALQAVHRAGIQHRDVKPGNVLIEQDGRPRLTDFGIASTAGDSSLTSTGVLLGSPSYLPPERARGEPGGPESDLWGLAATLYTAVEGVPPYDGSHPLAVLTAVVEGRRRPTSRAGALEPLLGDLLDRSPADRPETDEVRRRLVEVAGPDLGALLIDPLRSPGLPAPRRADAPPTGGIDVGTEALAVGDATDGPASPDPASSDTPSSDTASSDAARSDEAAASASPGTDDGTEALPATAGAVSPPANGSLSDTASLQVVPGPSTPPSRPRRPRPRRRRVVLSAAAGLLALLLAGGAVAALGDRSSPDVAAPAASAPGAGSAPAVLGPASLDATTATVPTPAGWVRYTDPSGWSIAHPADWRQTRLGEQGVDFVEPGTGSYLHVETADPAPASVAADWAAQEKMLAPRVSNYAQVAMRPADGGDGSRAADWEFTFELAGSPLHALDRGISSHGTGYTLYWQTPAPAWTSSLPTLGQLFGSFAPK